MQQETTDTQEYQLAMESFLKGGELSPCSTKFQVTL